MLTWDQIDQRIYEMGLDRGVLYLPNGSAVPWNGLTSIVESFDKSSSPVYYDGMKINDLVTLGSFSGTMKALTYPDEFQELEGLAAVKRGVFYADQPPKPFGLCYRTKIGTADEEDAGYKIHLLYNVTAMPHDKTHLTANQNSTLTEFEWAITAVPEEIPGFHPTAHIEIDSREIDSEFLAELEAILYGTDSVEASLLPMSELVALIGAWTIVSIVDNGDGTWTASTTRSGYISVAGEQFTLSNVNARYLDADTYEISDTT